MKKLMTATISCFLAVALLFSFTSCGASIAQVERAIQRTQEQKTMHIAMTMKIQVEVDGVFVDANSEMDFKTKRLDDGSSIMSGTLTVKGEGIRKQVYEVHGDKTWIYIVKPDGKKYKLLANEGGAEYDLAASANEMTIELSDELLEKAKLNEAEDGSVELSITIPAKEASSMFGSVVQEVRNSLGSSVRSVEIESIVYKVTVKNRYAQKYDVAINMNTRLALSGGHSQDVSTFVKMEMNILDIGTELDVRLPADLDDYWAVDKLP